MTRTFPCTLGVIALAAGLASAQATDGGAQGTPAPKSHTGSQTNSGSQKNTNQTSRTYTGCLQGSAASGYTLMTMGGNSVRNQAGSKASSTSANNTGTMTYTVLPGTSNADLSTMANQRVEIVGTVANPHAGADHTQGTGATRNTESPAGAAGNTPSEGGNTAAGAAGNTSTNGTGMRSSTNANAGMSGANAHQNLTITSVRVVPGGCTQ